ncbi:MAG: AAA family ATPase, partial [Chloroflexota bacterium]|nr:AAA family ATPase [Chloroflexota bacterium]
MTIRESPGVRSGRLRELRLHGFKTFADPTRFVFEPGINAVIGPNGSGKSNMADAVRWVLGEQSNRSLRTRRGDDVIFTGSQQRRPQGMAEAILTLDNFDGWLPIEFGEVSIGRRAYRSGESEYLINGAPARLREVVDLLAGGRLGANELVVVGQGTVDAALSLRPEERRQLFEEAAGVKSLQVRKNEALARLGRARDNLTRASDLIAELRPRARRLGLQAQHQQEHDSLGHRARWLVGTLHRRRQHLLQERAGEARRAVAAAEGALAAFRRDQESGRAEVLAAEGRYGTADRSARAAAERREATRDGVIRAETRLESLAARERETASTVAGLERELAMIEEQLSEGLPDATHAESVISAARAAEARWVAAVTALRDAEDRSIALEGEAERARHAARARARDVLQRVEQSAAIAARTRRLEDELAGAREELVAATAESAVARSLAEAADTDLVDAEQELASARRQRDEASGAADDGRRLADELEARVRLMTAELEELRHRGEQAASVEGVLRTAGWRGLLDEIEPPSDAWLALEAVVGGELERALLWRDDDLRPRLETARGVVRLLAAEVQPSEDRAQAMAAVGGTQTLAEWLGLPNAPRLLRRAVVVSDLDALLAGWDRLPEGWVAVTPAGDLADARGVLTLHGRGEA